MQLSKRKKNLQLKKIDIALTTFNGFSETPKSKGNVKLPSTEHPKGNVLSQKNTDDKMNSSFRKSFLHQKKQESSKINRIMPRHGDIVA
jgi:hypothetical protein